MTVKKKFIINIHQINSEFNKYKKKINKWITEKINMIYKIKVKYWNLKIYNSNTLNWYVSWHRTSDCNIFVIEFFILLFLFKSNMILLNLSKLKVLFFCIKINNISMKSASANKQTNKLKQFTITNLWL